MHPSCTHSLKKAPDSPSSKGFCQHQLQPVQGPVGVLPDEAHIHNIAGLDPTLPSPSDTVNPSLNDVQPTGMFWFNSCRINNFIDTVNGPVKQGSTCGI